jgi:hypothetical protein
MATVIRAWTSFYVFCDLGTTLYGEHKVSHQHGTLKAFLARFHRDS